VSGVTHLGSGSFGVEIAGTGRCLPEGRLTNADLEQIMDTSDEWITQRTGISERRICDVRKGESTTTLSAEALTRALEDAGATAGDLDLVIVASVTGEMVCPATACRVAAMIGAPGTGAFDILAACSGFVYGMATAHSMIRSGLARTVGVVGCDAMSRVIDYENRAVSILFGDAAGAAVLRRCDDPGRGLVAAELHADGSRWRDLYLPQTTTDVPEAARVPSIPMHALQMNGREVYKFAVGTFGDLIQSTLEGCGLTTDDVSQFVCHQSNARMLESARSRLGIPEEKMYVNIDRYGNCSAGSVPVALDELRKSGRCREGETIMLVAFGGGLTWASNVWRL